MSKKMKRITLFTALLVLLISIPSTLAYFTANDTAGGEGKVTLKEKTDIEEKVEDYKKLLTVTADDDSDPVFVRAKAFGPDGVKLEYSGEGWSLGDDDFYYYANPIAGTGTAYVDAPYNLSSATSVLTVTMSDLPSDTDLEEFHVVVVYEATPAFYSEGKWTCNWNNTVVGGGD